MVHIKTVLAETCAFLKNHTAASLVVQK